MAKKIQTYIAAERKTDFGRLGLVTGDTDFQFQAFDRPKGKTNAAGETYSLVPRSKRGMERDFKNDLTIFQANGYTNGTTQIFLRTPADAGKLVMIGDDLAVGNGKNV